jgi:hypothetical protein
MSPICHVTQTSWTKSPVKLSMDTITLLSSGNGIYAIRHKQKVQQITWESGQNAHVPTPATCTSLSHSTIMASDGVFCDMLADDCNLALFKDGST